MTSIIGIKTNDGEESVVIGSDSQMSYAKEGDLSEDYLRKKPVKKIIRGDSWLLAHAGAVTEDLYRFQRVLSGYKKYGSSEDSVKEIILNSVKAYEDWKASPGKSVGLHFKKIVELNATMLRTGAAKLEELVRFIFATNFPDLGGIRLFSVDEFGNMKEPKDREFEYCIEGSGSEKIQGYIQNLIDDEGGSQFLVDTVRAIDIVFYGLKKAERDIYTSGPIDLIVLTKQGIDCVGDEIKETLVKAELAIIAKIKEKYKRQQE